MLYNIDNVIPVMTQTMQILNYDFFLTGLQFFNSEQKTNKIWEFFVQDSSEIVDWLICNNFQPQDTLILPGGTKSYRYSDTESGIVIYITTVKSQRTMNKLHQTVKRLNPNGFKTDQELQAAQTYAFALYLDFNPNGQME